MKIALFKTHVGDPLSEAIKVETRTGYTHAAVVTNEATNEISEAYVPHVRRRLLKDSELAGIDFFDVVGLTPDKTAGALAYCAAAEAAQEPYSVENLFRFIPVFREVLGEAKDADIHSPVICSQYSLDVLDRGAGIKVLNAPSYEVDPGHIPWSPLVIPSAPLKPVGNN